MGFAIEKVVPWGRNLEEYRRMFSLTDNDLDQRILGCADGPASFNAEMHEQGKNCVSIDPIYQFSASQIKERIRKTADTVAEQMTKNRQDYLWDHYQSPENLLRIRLAAMDLFLFDFEKGKVAGRYLAGALPQLPLTDQSFDIVICSHCLFSYSHLFDLNFHQQAIAEICRVGKEVRIFPLLEVNGKPSRHLSSLITQMQQDNTWDVKIIQVDYEFQKGGNEMLLLQPR